MILSNVRFTHGLVGSAKPTYPKAASEQRLGMTFNAALPATKIYAIEAIMLGSAPTLTLTFTTGVATTSTAWTAGNAQVETATIVAAAGCTSNGTMTLVVVSAGMTTQNVAVALTTAIHTTATLIAGAARTALAANATIAARFTISGSGAAIILTRKPVANHSIAGVTVPEYAATDATLNLAIPVGLGITAAANSADTTAGVRTVGTYISGGAGKDFEGTTLAPITGTHGLLLKAESGTVSTTGPVGVFVRNGGAVQHSNPTDPPVYVPLVITGATDVTTRISLVVAAV